MEDFWHQYNGWITVQSSPGREGGREGEMAYILVYMDIIMILWMGPYYGVTCPRPPVRDRVEWAIAILLSL